ncbi:hypothetical protein Hdeb2414_s0245g00846221 [Helianthus debilis subsp. tardiflorus]
MRGFIKIKTQNPTLGVCWVQSEQGKTRGTLILAKFSQLTKDFKDNQLHDSNFQSSKHI